MTGPSVAPVGSSERRLRSHPDWFAWLATSIAVVLCALIVYPLGSVVVDVLFSGGAFDSGPFLAISAEQGLAKLIGNTLLAVGAASVCAVVVGSSFAWLNERTDVGMPFLGRTLPIIPLLVPPIAGAIGWILLAAPRAGFGNEWIKNIAAMLGFGEIAAVFNIFSWSGLIYVYAIYLLPHVYLTVSAGLRNLDPSLEEASRVSGAGPWSTLWRVTLPAVAPAVVSGAILAIINGLAQFSIPLIIGGQAGVEVLSVRIVHAMIASYPPQTGVALILGTIIVLLIGGTWMVQRAILRAGRFATIGGRGMRATPVRLGMLRWPLRAVMVLYLLLSSVLPLLALAIVSLQPFWSPKIYFANLSLKHYAALFSTNSLAGDGLRNSILLGIAGATVGMLIAAIVTFFVDRNQDSKFATLVDGATKLPAAVSHLVIGIAFISAFAGPPFNMHGTLLILFLAYIVLYIPQATLTTGAALAQVGKPLVEASLVAGASTGGTFVRVTLPLIVPGFAAGWTMLFVLIAGDITASAMLAGNRNPVSGFVILELWTNGSFPPLAAFAMIITLLMSTVVLISLRITRRRQ